MNSRAIANLDKQITGIRPNQWTQLAMAVSLCARAKLTKPEASQWFDSGFEDYKSAGNKETLTSPFGHIYYLQLGPLGVKEKAVEACDFAHRSMTFIVKAVSEDFTPIAADKVLGSKDIFTIGCVDEALKLHKEVHI